MHSLLVLCNWHMKYVGISTWSMKAFNDNHSVFHVWNCTYCTQYELIFPFRWMSCAFWIGECWIQQNSFRGNELRILCKTLLEMNECKKFVLDTIDSIRTHLNRLWIYLPSLIPMLTSRLNSFRFNDFCWLLVSSSSVPFLFTLSNEKTTNVENRLDKLNR